MPSVLFVCLGNICRSPMAEAVFRHAVEINHLACEFPVIDSCGTAGYHVGEKPDSRSIKTCVKHGIKSIESHRGQQLREEHFKEFDWILCMDDSNYEDIMEVKPKGSKAQVSLFGKFDPENQTIIKDPYYGGINGFEVNFDQVTRCSLGFLRHVGYKV